MATWRSIQALMAAAMLVMAGCGMFGESTGEGDEDASTNGDNAAVAQLGDGTEHYQYVPKKKKRADTGLTDVKPIKVGNQKYTYPSQSDAPEVIADAMIYSDKSFVLDGKFEEYRSDGKTPHAVGEFKNDHRHGKWIYYHPNGKVAKEMNYVDGLLEGAWTHFGENGEKNLDATYKNGKRHGTWTNYATPDEDGKQVIAQTMQFTDGRLDGPSIQFYPSAKKRVERNYKAGQQHGKQIIYYESGQKYSEANYEENVLQGMVTIWDEKGSVVKQREYRNGTPLRTTTEESAKSAATASAD